jgi:aminopeptidase N
MKYLRIFTAGIMLCVAGISFGHTGNQLCSRALRLGGNPNPWPDYPHRPYDVKKYQLTLDWRKIFETRSQQYSGVNVITVVTTDTTSGLTFDIGLLKLDSVIINGTPLQKLPKITSNETFTVPLAANLQASGTQITVRIAYHRDTLINQGIYFYPKGMRDPYLVDTVREDIAYTMSEPTDAHYWMPCNDQPYDKAESEISIIVPNGIEAASNGTLTSKSAYTPTSTIWNWKSDEPIATYLMVADASTFIHWGETHHRTSAPGDTVHLDYYAWPADYYQDSITDGSAFNAQYFLSRNTSIIMTWLEARFGGFPFVKYGQVPASIFSFGGMEHQTLTTIHRRWLKGDDDGIAHEMTHQWFGDKTTCETFKDIWLNEGFATYGESQWAEAWGGDQWYMNLIRGNAQSYFGGPNDFPVYDPPADNVFNGATTYSKGSCVLHMLRRMVNNDTMFFGALKDYSNAFAYTTANTMQFRDFIGQRLGMDLFEFFDQWIFTALHPIYDIKWAQNANDLFFLQVNQTQTIRDHFTMPMKFFAYHNGSLTPDTLAFQNNLRSQSFRKVLSYKIDSLIFDHDELILSVDTVSYAPELSVHSVVDPSAVFTAYSEGNVISCRFSGTEQSGILEIYNTAGMKISETEIPVGEIVRRIPCSDFASGMYFLRFKNAVQRVTILR